jgi:hypothetical protein
LLRRQYYAEGGQVRQLAIWVGVDYRTLTGRHAVRDDESGDAFVGSLGDNAAGDKLIFGAVGAAGDDAPRVRRAKAGERVELVRGGDIDVEEFHDGLPAARHLLLEGHLSGSLASGEVKRGTHGCEQEEALQAHR